MKTKTPADVQQVIDILSRCHDTTESRVRAQDQGRGSQTAEVREEAAYKAAFRAIVGRIPIDEELNAILRGFLGE